MNCDFINIFIGNNVLAFVSALRFALKIIAMLQAKSPIWPQNESPGCKMNLQAWLAYKNILNFREKMTSALLSWKVSWVFFFFSILKACILPLITLQHWIFTTQRHTVTCNIRWNTHLTGIMLPSISWHKYKNCKRGNRSLNQGNVGVNNRVRRRRLQYLIQLH